MHTCAHCANTFAGRKRKYCSKKCCVTAQTLKQNAKRKTEGYAYRKTIKATCLQCGTEFLGRGGTDAKYCSKTCGAIAALPVLRANTPVPQPQPPKLVQCEWCNALHAPKGIKKYCSKACVRQAMLAQGKTMRSTLRAAIEDGDHTAVITQIRQRSTVTPDGCWEWNGRVLDAYPLLRIGKKNHQVHRIVLEAKHQAVLGSQAAHHKCANSKCVNPDHLQPVTHRENVAEMLARHSYLNRIRELENALRAAQPDHPLLGHIEVA